MDVHVDIAIQKLHVACCTQTSRDRICMYVCALCLCACAFACACVRTCVCVCVCVHLFSMHAYNMCSLCIHLNLPVLISVCLCVSFLYTKTERTVTSGNTAANKCGSNEYCYICYLKANTNSAKCHHPELFVQIVLYCILPKPFYTQGKLTSSRIMVTRMHIVLCVA